MKYAIVFWCVTGICLYEAITLNGWALPLLWPGLSFFLAGLAYAGAGPVLLGKQPDGSIHPLALSTMLPYFLFTWLLWHLWRLTTRDAPFHELYQGVWIGRRLLAHEYPDTVTTIFDLTAEFPEIGTVRTGRVYHAYPTLDATPLASDMLRLAAAQVLDADNDVYIHCANGYGRTGSLTAAVLLMSGKVKNVDEAIDYLTSKRPALKLNEDQLTTLTAFWRESAPIKTG